MGCLLMFPFYSYRILNSHLIRYYNKKKENRLNPTHTYLEIGRSVRWKVMWSMSWLSLVEGDIKDNWSEASSTEASLGNIIKACYSWNVCSIIEIIAVWFLWWDASPKSHVRKRNVAQLMWLVFHARLTRTYSFLVDHILCGSAEVIGGVVFYFLQLSGKEYLKWETRGDERKGVHLWVGMVWI